MKILRYDTRDFELPMWIRDLTPRRGPLRVNHEGGITNGYVQRSRGCCYIPISGHELGFPDYEVLMTFVGFVSPVILESVSRKTFRERLHWLPMVDGKLPPDAMIGGFENEHIYIARAYHNSSLCTGKYVKSAGKAFVTWGGREHCKEQFEILCGFNAKWIKTKSNHIPQNAFIGGRTGGAEVNNEPLYIGRAMYDGRLICGKAYARYNLCYLPYKGREIEISSYEILVTPDDEIQQALPFTTDLHILPFW